MKKITLKKSNITLEYDTQDTLLEFLEENNIPVESACRSAACGTCMIKCLEGKVGTIMDHSFLSDEEKAEGLVLSCVSVPGTDLVLDL